MLANLTYLAAAVIAITVIARKAPNTLAAVGLSVALIALVTVLATLSRSDVDPVQVLQAIAALLHGPQNRS